MNQFTPVCSHAGCAANYCNEWRGIDAWNPPAMQDRSFFGQDRNHKACMERWLRQSEEEARRNHAEIVGDGWDADGRPVEDA